MKTRGFNKVIAACLACLLILAFVVGCSSGTASSPPPSTSVPKTSAAPPATSAPAPAPATSAPPASAPAAQAAAKVIELRVSHHDTPISDIQKIFEELGKRVDKATGSKVKLTIYPSETLAKSANVHDSTASGLVDIGFGMTGTTPGRYNFLDIFNLPSLGLTNSEMASACANAMAQKYASEFQKEMGPNVKLLYITSTSPDIIGTKSKAIRTIADFQGLKTRAAGANAIAHLKAMGAAPVMMSPGEIYTNVEKGVIDGWNMPWGGVANFKLHEVTKYYTETRNWVGPFFVIMNSNKFNSMPKDVQDQMMSVFGTEWNLWEARFRDASDAAAKKDALSKGGELITFTPEERAKMQAAAKPIWDDYTAQLEAKGIPGKAILADAVKFINEYKPAK
jgi:TRAP-type transport system periplasmic protein